jgi:hypothetical protein
VLSLSLSLSVTLLILMITCSQLTEITLHIDHRCVGGGAARSWWRSALAWRFQCGLVWWCACACVRAITVAAALDAGREGAGLRDQAGCPAARPPDDAGRGGARERRAGPRARAQKHGAFLSVGRGVRCQLGGARTPTGPGSARGACGSHATGAGGDHGIAKLWNRRELSVSSDSDRSHYLHPHP